jgi:hypothetical protein
VEGVAERLASDTCLLGMIERPLPSSLRSVWAPLTYQNSISDLHVFAVGSAIGPEVRG